MRDDRLRCRVPQDLQPLARTQAIVHRYRHHAALERPVVEHEPFEAVLGDDPDPVAAADAELPERAGEAVAQLVEFAKAPLSLFVLDANRVGVALRPVLQELVNAHDSPDP